MENARFIQSSQYCNFFFLNFRKVNCKSLKLYVFTKFSHDSSRKINPLYGLSLPFEDPHGFLHTIIKTPYCTVLRTRYQPWLDSVKSDTINGSFVIKVHAILFRMMIFIQVPRYYRSIRSSSGEYML